MNYCRIFTELAESFLEKILNQCVMKTHFAIKIFDLVLICVGHHDYEVCIVICVLKGVGEHDFSNSFDHIEKPVALFYFITTGNLQNFKI